MTISKFPLWRRLFWRRVMCHKCGERPAVLKCVWRGEKLVYGEDYARDPLCERHGRPGRCPCDPEAEHVPIPEVQRWRRVYWRFQSPIALVERD